MSDLTKPVARDDETLVHLHFIKPSPVEGQVVVPASQSTWIGTSVSRRLRLDRNAGRIVLDVTIDVDGLSMPEDAEPNTDDDVDVTEVRTRLYHGGVEYLRRRHPHNKVMAGKAEPGDPRATAFDAYEGYCAAGIFQIALSTVLRYLNQEVPEHAQVVARIADEVMESGLDALDDTNDDLSHPAPSSAHALDVATTPGCFECGIPFEFDGPKSQEPGTTNCRVCADAGPTPADIEAALDAKAEDERIEAERAR